jgi:hypothetical protein
MDHIPYSDIMILVLPHTLGMARFHTSDCEHNARSHPHYLITQIMQPLRGSHSTFRYHNPGATAHPRGMPQLGDFTQWIMGISRASLARGSASLVLLNSSSIDHDLAQAHDVSLFHAAAATSC